MMFNSMLFLRNDFVLQNDPPEFFVDLNLDQIIDDIVASKQQYNLTPFFYTPLADVDTIYYRQEIMREFENPTVSECIRSFAQKMDAMRGYLAQADKLRYPYQKERLFLDAVERYGLAVDSLASELTTAELKSRGFLAFREYVTAYCASGNFTSLLAETKKLVDDLSSIQYCVHIKGNTIKVSQYEFVADYSAVVEETFEKFKRSPVKDYRVKFSDPLEMNHVEAKILDLVAQLYPDIFSHLHRYYEDHNPFQDAKIAVFDREIQFYVAYLAYIATLKRADLKFCYPQILTTSKEICNYGGFDLALSYKFAIESLPVVCNDFYLRDKERIFVVSGPNQGGKTTFARTFGQLHYLAILGCPVPGKEARLFLFDHLFTHFERVEDINKHSGKLQDDLLRIHSILHQATPNSVIIMNEIFSSTTLQDAIALGKRVMEKMMQLDLLCVFVTFIDELTSYGEGTVSLVSTVEPEKPTVRTYKIVRKAADGRSYAKSIAEKYGLTYDRLKERIRS